MLEGLKIVALCAMVAVVAWRVFAKGATAKEVGGWIAAMIVVVILGMSVGAVPTGSIGVVLRFGAITGRTLGEGIYVVMPLTESVQVMSAQVHAYSVDAAAATSDAQGISTTITVNYQLDRARCMDIYRTMRDQYESRVIVPGVQESVKAATARYNAQDLISKREEVRMAVKALLFDKLEKQFGIRIIDVSITNIEFTDSDFRAALEKKAKMTQDAITALRNLEKVKYEQQAKVEVAKADAESQRLLRQNVTPEVLQLRKLEVQKAAIDKWDGKYPNVMTGNSPLLMQIPGN